MCVCGGEAENREQRGEERTPDRAPPTSGFSRFLLRAPLSFLATRPAAPVTRPGRPAHSQPSWPGQALAKPQPAEPAPIRLTTCPLFRKHNRLSPASPVPAVGRPPAPALRAAPQVRIGRARGVLFTSPRQPRVDCPVPLPGKRGWLVRARGACGAAETGHTLPRGGPVARPPAPVLILAASAAVAPRRAARPAHSRTFIPSLCNPTQPRRSAPPPAAEPAPASTSATAAPSPPSAAAPHSGSSDFDFGRYMASRAAAVNAALDAAVPAVYPEAVTESMR